MVDEVPPQPTSQLRPDTPVVTDVSSVVVAAEGRLAATPLPPTVDGSRPPSRSPSPHPTSSTQVVSRPVSDTASGVAVNDTAVEKSRSSMPLTSSDSFGHMTGGHSPDGVAMEDVIAFLEAFRILCPATNGSVTGSRTSQTRMTYRWGVL